MNKRSYRFPFSPETILGKMKEDLTRELSGTVKQIKFYAPDGIELSKRSTFKHLMTLPFFTMKTNLS
jgi:hypothetical protein